jgi:hypothetical protein
MSADNISDPVTPEAITAHAEAPVLGPAERRIGSVVLSERGTYRRTRAAGAAGMPAHIGRNDGMAHIGAHDEAEMIAAMRLGTALDDAR